MKSNFKHRKKKNKNIFLKIIKYIVGILAFLVVYIVKDGRGFGEITLITAVFLILMKLSVVFVKGNIEAEISIKGKEVLLSIKNPQKIPMISIEVDIVGRNIITGQSEAFSKNISIMPKKISSLKFEVDNSRIGAIEVFVEEIKATDILGIFKKRLYEKGNGESKYRVCTYNLPKIQDGKIKLKHIESHNMESFRYSNMKKGEDTSEVFAVDEYQGGDRVKSIHWKLSSKMDKLMVRKFSYPVESNIIVFADKSLDDNITFDEKEKATKMALDLSYSLCNDEIVHQMVWYDGRENKLCKYKVSSKEDIKKYIYRFLESPFMESIEGPYKQITKDDIKGKKSIILVSKRKSLDIEVESLMRYGEVSVYRGE